MQNCKLSDFTIGDRLGKGGFGSAYLAVHKRTEREVCIKFITLKGGGSSRQRSALEEAKILSELADSHIIKYYGSFVESGSFFIVMEYAKEGSLDTMIAVSCCPVISLIMYIYSIRSEKN